jgi:hypothetical protein
MVGSSIPLVESSVEDANSEGPGGGLVAEAPALVESVMVANAVEAEAVETPDGSSMESVSEGPRGRDND